VRILGLDPGLRSTGFGVIEAAGGRLRYVASGRVRSQGRALAARLRSLHEGVAEVVARHAPAEVAVEKVFVNENPASTLALGEGRASAILAAALAGLPVAEYTALQVKQAVTGTGRASKEQVKHMVRRLLALAGEPSADAADALACAICHAHGRRLGPIAVAQYRRRRGRLR